MRHALEAPTIRKGKPPAAPPPGVLAPGSELAGRYRILELLGEGGMGVVYRARDLSLDIDVALKRLHPRIAHDPDKVAFFRNEVRIARKVTHPNVCRLHDLVDEPGGCFITMEHVGGESLAARLARGRLDLPAALAILRDIARGVAAAHAAGVIHRDLKPSNVLLAADRAVVADFGIAGEGTTLAAAPQDVAGTRGYMAPEQATGRPLDARVDVYALGVLGFVLATGQRPPPAVTHTADPAPPQALPINALGQGRAVLPAANHAGAASSNALPIGELAPGHRPLPAIAHHAGTASSNALPIGELAPGQRPPPAIHHAGAASSNALPIGELAPGQRPPPAIHHAGAASSNALPIGELGPGLAALPADLAALLADCLAADPADRPRDAGDVLARLDALAPLPGVPRRRWPRIAAVAVALLAFAAFAAAAVTRRPDAPAPVAPRIALPALDASGLPEPDRWLAPVVQHLIGDELTDAWGLDVELEASAHPAPGTVAIAGQLARDPSGRFRLALDGAALEAATPRELALAAAAQIVARRVPEPARRPTAADLAAVGAHDAEAWRLWRRAQHETLLMRWDRATALCAQARARDPGFPVAALEAALIYDNKDAAADRQLAEAARMMERVPVRPLWRLAATVARQLMNDDAAGAARTVDAARQLELDPRERLWIELRWAMVRTFDDSAQTATAALELIAERNPNHPAAFKLLASVELGSDSPSAPTLALRYATRAVELAPDDAGARADLAVALLIAGRRDEARARAAELDRLDPDDKRLARSRLFTLHIALGDLAQAEVDARRQLTGSPSQRAEGTSGVAMIDLYRGRFALGLGELIASADAYDALDMTVSAARQRLLAARQAQLLGDRATAIAAFDRIAAGRTQYARLARVLSRIAAGRLDDARAAIPAIPAASVERAAADLALADAARDAPGVLSAFARIEQLSTTIEQLYAVGDALERRGRHDEAAAVFERLASHAHAWSEPIAATRAWYRLGLLRERAHDTTGARAAFAEVVTRWSSATTRMPEVDDARRRLKPTRSPAR